jgi:tRNA-splicing endonuclease subunit Sen54
MAGRVDARALDESADPTDETTDFRFLAALTAGSSAKLPRRGEKDFEPHGTAAQAAVLEASRRAMHDALAYTRVHAPKGSGVRAWFLGHGVAGAEACLDASVRGRGLDPDHVVLVEAARGPMFKTMGRAARGRPAGATWLLPEEALYLVERGGLDLYWPHAPERVVRGDVRPLDAVAVDAVDDLLDCDEDDLPLSLQAAWALLVGDGRGMVAMDTYNVYANLKRNGYAVLRIEAAVPRIEATALDRPLARPIALFQRLYAMASQKPSPALGDGPLLARGLYRSYASVYDRLAIIPRHIPAPASSASPPAPAPAPAPASPAPSLRPLLAVYKSSRISSFAKSAPGPPDFRIAIVSARTACVPRIDELDALFAATPYAPPDASAGGVGRVYARLRHGHRSALLAVVDRGVISYLRLAEAAWGLDGKLVGLPSKATKGAKRR